MTRFLRPSAQLEGRRSVFTASLLRPSTIAPLQEESERQEQHRGTSGDDGNSVGAAEAESAFAPNSTATTQPQQEDEKKEDSTKSNITRQLPAAYVDFSYQPPAPLQQGEREIPPRHPNSSAPQEPPGQSVPLIGSLSATTTTTGEDHHHSHQHDHHQEHNHHRTNPTTLQSPPSSNYLTSHSFLNKKGEEPVGERISTTCECCAVEEIQALIEEGIDIDQTAEDGNTPLAVASFHGDLAVAQFLVANGADANLSAAQGAPPLHWASRNGHAKIISLLCSHGADPNKEARDGLTPLACAAVEGHADCVQLLLEVGAWPNLDHKDTQETPLCWAAHEGHYEALQTSLQHGAEPDEANRVGETPLFWAARNGFPDCAECLLDSGDADPNAVTWDKQTPIFWAAKEQHHDCVETLLEHGADPNIVTKTVNRCITTPLEAALHNGDKECVKTLHEHGAVEDFSIHKGWHDTADAPFLAFLLELDWTWDSKQFLLEAAIRNIRDDQVLLKLLHSRLDDLNRESSDRKTIFLLMLELHLHVLWVDCFVSIVFNNICQREALTAHGGPAMMLALTFFFVSRKFSQPINKEDGTFMTRGIGWTWQPCRCVLLP